MKIAYLVLAHSNPQLLIRTVRRLSCADAAFFVHVDSKSDFTGFGDLIGGNIFVSQKRIPVYWGEFSQVDAILLLLHQALEHSQDFRYFFLISGSDYPLRSAHYIHAFVKQNCGCNFMDLVKMPAPGKPVSRINTLRFESNKPMRRFTVRALAKLGLAQRDYRKHLGGLEPYSGSTWWALTREACDYIVKFMECNPDVTKYFRNTFAPDEAFFHTILANSVFAGDIRRSLVYTDWSDPGPKGAHPAQITDKHLAVFEAQNKVWITDSYGSGEVLLARKFSPYRPDLLQRIDEMIERKEKQ
jgi:hypothetical protein